MSRLADLPNVDAAEFRVPSLESLTPATRATHPPRILLLYGSLRSRSFSRLLTFEAARLLEAMGCETRIFDPAGLPLPDGAPDTHPKVAELRALAAWSEGMVWTSPERHGAMTGIMKAQIDWIPLNVGALRPTQGKTLAVMEVSGGSQSFNAVNQMRILGRWMRMITIPNQSSVAKAYLEFDEQDRMKPSSYYERVVDVMEELVRFTLLTRDVSAQLVDRYSERRESAAAFAQRVPTQALGAAPNVTTTQGNATPMNELSAREKALIGLSAAVASNCIPCVEHHLPLAHSAGLSDEEIRAALALADAIRQVPARKVLARAQELVAVPAVAGEAAPSCNPLTAAAATDPHAMPVSAKPAGKGCC